MSAEHGYEQDCMCADCYLERQSRIRASSFAAPAGCAQHWKCDLGNGEWDHDWVEKHDSAGGEGGGPMIQWSWRECRACGITEEEAHNADVSDRRD